MAFSHLQCSSDYYKTQEERLRVLKPIACREPTCTKRECRVKRDYQYIEEVCRETSRASTKPKGDSLQEYHGNIGHFIGIFLKISKNEHV